MSLSDGSSLPNKTIKIKVKEGDIITFPAHNLHYVTVKDKNKEETRLLLVIGYYISSGNDAYAFWDGSEIVRIRMLRRKPPEITAPKTKTKKATPKT